MSRMDLPFHDALPVTGETRLEGEANAGWGAEEELLASGRFRVRHLVVRPGASLPMQAHYHRFEHFVVVGGAGRIRMDDREILLKENGTVFVPLGRAYAIENHGKVPLQLIEIRTGSYTGDDDLMPLEEASGAQPA